ncbi:uncharacterized protein LOC121920327 [Sceloporus undulatus]|uniref:uncharacterized protein LOC121920327 n=1 Tax=Sceloporus undulatus TaxID=8520 RepID=UPI001C4C4754|nr:uncharacterized protein LOC121920327 [Sceloporus undulatus]
MSLSGAGSNQVALLSTCQTEAKFHPALFLHLHRSLGFALSSWSRCRLPLLESRPLLGQLDPLPGSLRLPSTTNPVLEVRGRLLHQDPLQQFCAEPILELARHHRVRIVRNIGCHPPELHHVLGHRSASLLQGGELGFRPIHAEWVLEPCTKSRHEGIQGPQLRSPTIIQLHQPLSRLALQSAGHTSHLLGFIREVVPSRPHVSRHLREEEGKLLRVSVELSLQLTSQQLPQCLCFPTMTACGSSRSSPTRGRPGALDIFVLLLRVGVLLQVQPTGCPGGGGYWCQKISWFHILFVRLFDHPADEVYSSVDLVQEQS